MQRSQQELDKILNETMEEFDKEVNQKTSPPKKSLLEGAFNRGVRIGPSSPKHDEVLQRNSEEYQPIKRRPNRCHDFFKPVAQWGGFVAGLYLDFAARPHNPYYSNIICGLLWGFLGGKTVDLLSGQDKENNRRLRN